MNLEQQPSIDLSQETILDPESLDKETLSLILREGQVYNIHTIEEDEQVVPLHQDRVLTAQLTHKDKVFEAEVVLPDSDKKLKVVYKPESGIGKGTEEGIALPIPEDASSNQNKEVAAWIVIQALGLEHLATPVTIRDLGEGSGSVRAFFKGQPIEILNSDEKDIAYSDRNQAEEIATVDYVLQTIDRRDTNIIAKPKAEGYDLKLIDHSMTFFDEKFSNNFARRIPMKGPRLMVGYDNSTEPPTLKLEILPDRIQAKIAGFLKNKDEIARQLEPYLNPQEIEGTFDRARKLRDQNIFL